MLHLGVRLQGQSRVSPHSHAAQREGARPSPAAWVCTSPPDPQCWGLRSPPPRSHTLLLLQTLP